MSKTIEVEVRVFVKMEVGVWDRPRCVTGLKVEQAADNRRVFESGLWRAVENDHVHHVAVDVVRTAISAFSYEHLRYPND
jgi:hypothetical protein